jgi:hypothetical protein
MPELKNVTLSADPDPDPPTDHLGEYQDTRGPKDRTIDRKERGDMGPRELRYFVAAQSEYAEENYKRMEQYASGGVSSYGIRAVAAVGAAGTVQRIESPGLWGVPSDADSGYVSDVASEQLHVLREVLDAFGVEFDGPLTAEWRDDCPWSGTESE